MEKRAKNIMKAVNKGDQDLGSVDLSSLKGRR
jgi:hypothetical protein